jgi:hypothetical protein
MVWGGSVVVQTSSGGSVMVRRWLGDGPGWLGCGSKVAQR